MSVSSNTSSVYCSYPTEFFTIYLFLMGYIVHHFGGPLMDDKNLTIQAQVVKALFALQILDSVQASLHQHC